MALALYSVEPDFLYREVKRPENENGHSPDVRGAFKF